MLAERSGPLPGAGQWTHQHHDAATGERLAVFVLPPQRHVAPWEEAPFDWGHLSIQGDYLLTTRELFMVDNQRPGHPSSYSATASSRLLVMDRRNGDILWEREARQGFRHNAIVSSGQRLYLVDGLPESQVALLTRRGLEAEAPSRLYALNVADGKEIWHTEDRVLGTFLLYCAKQDLLVEGGSHDIRHRGARPDEEPTQTIARRGADGVVNAIDYTRHCNCAYPHQTSLALVHMPDDPNIEFWMTGSGIDPDPAGHGINFGAPGRRIDIAGSERIWFPRNGSHTRHPSAILDCGPSIPWVLSSLLQVEGDETLTVETVKPGSCLVRFHFADLETTTQPVQRVFDIVVNGADVATGMDIVALAGAPMRGIVKEFPVHVDDHLTFRLRPANESSLPPIINGLELIARD